MFYGENVIFCRGFFMNNTTRWYEHKLYHWMNEDGFTSMADSLKEHCTKEAVESILKQFDAITLDGVEFYREGTYS